MQTTATIPLSRGYVAIVDAADIDTVMAAGPWWVALPRGRAYAMAAYRDCDGKRRFRYLHTFLTGFPITDHVDGDGLNNTRSNLRPASASENNCNKPRQANNASGYKGVIFDAARGLWRAEIQVLRKRRFLGRFPTAEEAAAAYDRAAFDLHGDFAHRNLIEE